MKYKFVTIMMIQTFRIISYQNNIKVYHVVAPT